MLSGALAGHGLRVRAGAARHRARRSSPRSSSWWASCCRARSRVVSRRRLRRCCRRCSRRPRSSRARSSPPAAWPPAVRAGAPPTSATARARHHPGPAPRGRARGRRRAGGDRDHHRRRGVRREDGARRDDPARGDLRDRPLAPARARSPRSSRRPAYSRVPVYEGRSIDVVGMVHAFDVLKIERRAMPAAPAGGVRGADGRRATSCSSACCASVSTWPSCGRERAHGRPRDARGPARGARGRHPRRARRAARRAAARADRDTIRRDAHAGSTRLTLADFAPAARRRWRAPSASSRTIAPGFDALLADAAPAHRPRAAHRHHRAAGRGEEHADRHALARALSRGRAARSASSRVDPTSPFTGGALLGDRIRMEAVALDPGVFIRSMATRGSLGGLSRRHARGVRRARRVRLRPHPHRDRRRRAERARCRAHGRHAASWCSCRSPATRSRRSRRG